MLFIRRLTRVGVPLIAIALCAAFCSRGCAQAPLSPAAAQTVVPQALAQPNGNLIIMPQNMPASRRSGLLLFVDTRWVNAYGYRPVVVTISSPTPTTADHLITVQLHSGWENVTNVEQDFNFPLGSTRASTTIAVPIYEQATYSFWWNVWVDGVKDLDLSTDKNEGLQGWGSNGISASSVRVLVPGSDATQKSLVSASALDFEVLSLALGDFPKRWIDYTCLDVVSLSNDDLIQLAKTNPAAIDAIERWVRTGGQLWVADVGSKLERLPEVSKQLHVPDSLLQAVADPGARDTDDPKNQKAGAASEHPADRPAEVGWRPGRLRGGFPAGQSQGFSDRRTGRNRWVNDPRVIAALELDPNFVRTNDLPDTGDDPNAERRWPQDSSEWYVEQRLGLGTLRAFLGINEAAIFVRTTPAATANANANGDGSGQISRGLAMGLRSTRHWDTRHGLIPDSSNPDFAKLLVPGVGLAPVTEFQILITLFAIVIGPFNYWILKRYRRLQLLVLTVPLAAGVATTGLFAYAIVSEGFATKVRVRSYTTLDQQTGEAACWARMSYYAGLAPGKGLTMPADVVMYPILPNWGSEDWGTNRSMVWDENEEKLTQGWLNSRTPTQYLMLRSRKTPHRLDVTAGNGKMQITNRLGTRIESLFVLDEAGKFFSGSELASESRVALQPISRDEAVKQIVALIRDNEPEAPAALSGSERDFVGRHGRSTRRFFGRYRPQGGGDQLNENLANRAMSDLAGMNGRPALDLLARSYVAVTATGPEVETGIPYAKEDGSFHVIVGRW